MGWSIGNGVEQFFYSLSKFLSSFSFHHGFFAFYYQFVIFFEVGKGEHWEGWERWIIWEGCSLGRGSIRRGKHCEREAVMAI